MPLNFHIFHFSFFNFLKNRELGEMYIAIAIRFLALSMIGIFVPVYLLFELNLSLQIVMYFFIVFSLVFGAFSFIAAKIAARIGFKHLILLSAPFKIAFYLLLAMLPVFHTPLFLIASLGAIAHCMYWIGHHTDLAKFTDRKSRGRQVSLTFFVAGIAVLIGPILGGLIITFYNFTVLFIIGSMILLVSTTPLFFSKEFYEKASFSTKRIFSKRKVKDAAGFIAQGMEISAAGAIWPIFIFTILGGYFSLGLLGTFAALIGSISSIIAGRVADIVGKRNLLRVGSFALIALWFFRTVVTKVFHVYVVTMFAFVGAFSAVPFDSLTYSKARFGRRIVEYLVFREVFINIGKAITLTIMLLTSSYIASFIFTGVAQVLLILF